MGTVLLYVGNFITGEVHRAAVPNDDDRICSMLEGFRKDLGWDYTVWAIYNISQTLEVRDVQFNNQLAQAYDEYIANAA